MEPRIARRASIEYMCVYCGRKEIRGWNAGRSGARAPSRDWVHGRAADRRGRS